MAGRKAKMILLKCCPRCLGDLLAERFPGEEDLVCIQCGYRRPLVSRAQFVTERLARLRARTDAYPAAA
jgi:hypothetical protein